MNCKYDIVFLLKKRYAISMNITYQNCNTISIYDMLTAFSSGFSDYSIKMDFNEETFQKRFFQQDKNQLEASFIAYDENIPIGIIFGSIQIYEGKKTMRCGGFGVAPTYRGVGVSKRLFQLFEQYALDQHCEQQFLEVLSNNEKAIRFYEREHFKKQYHLIYYKLDAITNMKPTDVVQELSFLQLSPLFQQAYEVHRSWNNSEWYINNLVDMLYYGIYEKNALIAGIALHQNGSIRFLWVTKNHRRQGIATKLLQHVFTSLDLTQMTINFEHNIPLIPFLKVLGFQKERIEQFEMYKDLKGSL